MKEYGDLTGYPNLPVTIAITNNYSHRSQSVNYTHTRNWEVGMRLLGVDVMDIGRHSNEDQIAPFSVWIEKYSDRIGLFGGFDLNLLVLENPDTIYQTVLEQGAFYRGASKGYGLGSGNSIPGYIPADGFMAMIEAVKEIRRKKSAK